MLRFFRTLRQRLLTEKQVSNYMLYAIGEIVLVVIGILIALQINTWNETRKDRIAEAGIIKNLHQEFTANRKTLDSTISVMEKTKNANLKLMGLFGESEAALKGINIDSIIFYSIEFHRFVPTQNALQDLLQSGRLHLITNEALKNLLFDWTRVMGLVEESYSMVKQKTEEDIVPYLTPRYPLKNIDAYGDLGWQEPSRISPPGNLGIFEDLSYENLVDDQLYRLFRYDKNMREARAIIEEILHLIEIHS